MRFDNHPWTRRRFVLEYATWIMSAPDITQEQADDIRAILRQCNAYRMSEAEAMRSLTAIMSKIDGLI